MRRLMLLRHAKSDWSSPGTRDRERTLAARGREAAPHIGAYMAAHALVPDLVVCSTADRARQTWDLVAPAFSPAPRTIHDERIYNAEHDAILDVIKQTPDTVHALLVVGHNPGLKDLAEFMVATGDLEMRQQLSEKLPTGALVVIDFPVIRWERAKAHSGRLDRFITPRSLGEGDD